MHELLPVCSSRFEATLVCCNTIPNPLNLASKMPFRGPAWIPALTLVQVPRLLELLPAAPKVQVQVHSHLFGPLKQLLTVE